MPVSASSCSFWWTPRRFSGQISGRSSASGLRSKVTATSSCAAGGGVHPGPVYHGAMPGVDAVELADRDDRRTEMRGHLGGVAKDHHGVTAAEAASVARAG